MAPNVASGAALKEPAADAAASLAELSEALGRLAPKLAPCSAPVPAGTVALAPLYEGDGLEAVLRKAEAGTQVSIPTHLEVLMSLPVSIQS